MYTCTGRRLDGAAGLYYYRHRIYHSQLGRFCSRDPVGDADSESNLYEYVSSSPTNLDDPEGNRRVRTQLAAGGSPCRVELRCAFIIGIPGIYAGLAQHCGLRVIHNGKVFDFHVATPGTCKIDSYEAGGPLFGRYRVFGDWSFADDKVCRCIKATAAAIPGGTYAPIPKNDPCGGPPTCNSNCMTKCLMNYCGLNFTNWNWLWRPVGWDHRMKVCTDVHKNMCGCYTCGRWETIDDMWCSKRARKML